MCVTGCNGSTVDMVRCGKFIETKMDKFVGVKFLVPIFRPYIAEYCYILLQLTL